MNASFVPTAATPSDPTDVIANPDAVVPDFLPRTGPSPSKNDNVDELSRRLSELFTEESRSIVNTPPTIQEQPTVQSRTGQLPFDITRQLTSKFVAQLTPIVVRRDISVLQTAARLLLSNDVTSLARLFGLDTVYRPGASISYSSVLETAALLVMKQMFCTALLLFTGQLLSLPIEWQFLRFGAADSLDATQRQTLHTYFVSVATFTNNAPWISDPILLSNSPFSAQLDIEWLADTVKRISVKLASLPSKVSTAFKETIENVRRLYQQMPTMHNLVTFRFMEYVPPNSNQATLDFLEFVATNDSLHQLVDQTTVQLKALSFAPVGGFDNMAARSIMGYRRDASSQLLKGIPMDINDLNTLSVQLTAPSVLQHTLVPGISQDRAMCCALNGGRGFSPRQLNTAITVFSETLGLSKPKYIVGSTFVNHTVFTGVLAGEQSTAVMGRVGSPGILLGYTQRPIHSSMTTARMIGVGASISKGMPSVRDLEMDRQTRQHKLDNGLSRKTAELVLDIRDACREPVRQFRALLLQQKDVKSPASVALLKSIAARVRQHSNYAALKQMLQVCEHDEQLATQCLYGTAGATLARLGLFPVPYPTNAKQGPQSQPSSQGLIATQAAIFNSNPNAVILKKFHEAARSEMTALLLSCATVYYEYWQPVPAALASSTRIFTLNIPPNVTLPTVNGVPADDTIAKASRLIRIFIGPFANTSTAAEKIDYKDAKQQTSLLELLELAKNGTMPIFVAMPGYDPTNAEHVTFYRWMSCQVLRLVVTYFIYGTIDVDATSPFSASEDIARQLTGLAARIDSGTGVATSQTLLFLLNSCRTLKRIEDRRLFEWTFSNTRNLHNKYKYILVSTEGQNRMRFIMNIIGQILVVTASGGGDAISLWARRSDPEPAAGAASTLTAPSPTTQGTDTQTLASDVAKLDAQLGSWTTASQLYAQTKSPTTSTNVTFSQDPEAFHQHCESSQAAVCQRILSPIQAALGQNAGYDSIVQQSYDEAHALVDRLTRIQQHNPTLPTVDVIPSLNDTGLANGTISDYPAFLRDYLGRVRDNAAHALFDYYESLRTQRDTFHAELVSRQSAMESTRQTQLIRANEERTVQDERTAIEMARASTQFEILTNVASDTFANIETNNAKKPTLREKILKALGAMGQFPLQGRSMIWQLYQQANSDLGLNRKFAAVAMHTVNAYTVPLSQILIDLWKLSGPLDPNLNSTPDPLFYSFVPSTVPNVNSEVSMQSLLERVRNHSGDGYRELLTIVVPGTQRTFGQSFTQLLRSMAGEWVAGAAVAYAGLKVQQLVAFLLGTGELIPTNPIAFLIFVAIVLLLSNYIGNMLRSSKPYETTRKTLADFASNPVARISSAVALIFPGIPPAQEQVLPAVPALVPPIVPIVPSPGTTFGNVPPGL